MVRINWTKQAVSDLQSIAEYFSKDSKFYGKREILKIRNATTILKTYPLSGKIISEITKSDFREVIQGNYRIIYKIVTNQRIDIITIHHASRSLPKRKDI
ncbi:type II toxin-antitoxin system RelE/ParE family toxin [uncultured Flavobacterium sp.]|uniref:type II toxin-antitoxin system RelE/ParE family toxin n=1 Tax=uncultured Flavobacterium sp. TaxID=165435 RepID=UPI0030C7DA32